MGSHSEFRSRSEQPKSPSPKFPGSQEQVPKQGSQARFAGIGSQEQANRFPSKVVKQGPQKQVKIIKYTLPERPPTRREISDMASFMERDPTTAL